MTPTEQRIAIAEAVGFKWYANPRAYQNRVCFLARDFESLLTLPYPYIAGQDNCPLHKAALADVPNYLDDLNAMHEAEKTLPAEQWNDYIQTLSIIASGLTGHMFFTYHATAAQRAEAFLRTIGKWKD